MTQSLMRAVTISSNTSVCEPAIDIPVKHLVFNENLNIHVYNTFFNGS
jgi:hypothetical protein